MFYLWMWVSAGDNLDNALVMVLIFSLCKFLFGSAGESFRARGWRGCERSPQSARSEWDSFQRHNNTHPLLGGLVKMYHVNTPLALINRAIKNPDRLTQYYMRLENFENGLGK